LLNRPTEKLSAPARAWVGTVAATTLVVSLLSSLALPALLPHRDAVTFVQGKRRELEAPPMPIASRESAKAQAEAAPRAH
jgi:hypothetical protein